MSTNAKYASIEGTSLAYFESGSGQPLLFVHGGITDHRIWAPQVQEISCSYRCIAVDQRYFGLSGSSNGPPFSLATHSHDLCQFIAKIADEPVHVVATSYGAAVALSAAVECPPCIRSLFLNEPSLASLVTDEDGLAVLADWRKNLAPVAAALSAGNPELAVGLFCDWTAFPGAFATLPTSAQAIFLDNARTLALQLSSPPPAVSSKQIAKLRIPVAFTTGDRTTPFFTTLLRAARRAIPRGPLTVIPGAHHGAPFENPDAFNAALLGFLDRQGEATT